MIQYDTEVSHVVALAGRLALETGVIPSYEPTDEHHVLNLYFARATVTVSLFYDRAGPYLTADTVVYSRGSEVLSFSGQVTNPDLGINIDTMARRIADTIRLYTDEELF